MVSSIGSSWHKSDAKQACPITFCRCNGGVRFALTQDPKESLRFAALQSNIGRALLQVASPYNGALLLSMQAGALKQTLGQLRQHKCVC